VIKTWANTVTRQFAETGKCKFSGLDEIRALARLQTLDATARIEEIPPLASIGLHRLSGTREGQWAMTINGPWRLVFKFDDGDAYDVEVVDYH